jgi:hypothetical protein
VSDEVLGDDLVSEAEVAVPQVLAWFGECGVGCVGHHGPSLTMTYIVRYSF